MHRMRVPFVVPSQVGLCRRLHHFEGSSEVHHRELGSLEHSLAHLLSRCAAL